LPASPASAFEIRATSQSRSSTSSTRLRARVLACLAVVVGGSLATAAAEPIWFAVAVALLLFTVMVAALELGLAAGSLAALASAAASVALMRLAGTWEPAAYVPLVLMVASFALTALAAAAVRGALEGMEHGRAPGPGAPANGSLGLLAGASAEARLDEEVERAAYADSPLTVVWMRTRLLDAEMSQPDRGRVMRVASRTIESVLEVVHLPVAYSDADIVGILTETDERAAERFIERIRRSSASATLLVGTERSRRRFSDLAAIDVGLAAYPGAGDSGAALLEAARAAIRRPDAGGHASTHAAAPSKRAQPADQPRPQGAGVPVMATDDDRSLVPR
jgi:hypothetical protein